MAREITRALVPSPWATDLHLPIWLKSRTCCWDGQTHVSAHVPRTACWYQIVRQPASRYFGISDSFIVSGPVYMGTFDAPGSSSRTSSYNEACKLLAASFFGIANTPHPTLSAFPHPCCLVAFSRPSLQTLASRAGLWRTSLPSFTVNLQSFHLQPCLVLRHHSVHRLPRPSHRTVPTIRPLKMRITSDSTLHKIQSSPLAPRSASGSSLYRSILTPFLVIPTRLSLLVDSDNTLVHL